MDRLMGEVRGLQDRIEVLESDAGIVPDEMSPGKRILICDDTRLVRALVKGVLEGSGYHCSEAGDGQEALDLLQDQAFDLIVLDIHMPDMNGAALLKNIRINQSNVDLPVIICSGSRDRQDYLQVSQYGVQGILMKPIKKEELLTCVEEVLSESRRLASSGDKTIFDPVSAVNRVGGDTDLLNELIVTFLEDLPTLLAGVRKAVQEDDPEATAESAHGLKGALSSLSATAAASAAAALELIGREERLSDARSAYSALEKESNRLREEFESFLKPKR